MNAHVWVKNITKPHLPTMLSTLVYSQIQPDIFIMTPFQWVCIVHVDANQNCIENDSTFNISAIP